MTTHIATCQMPRQNDSYICTIYSVSKSSHLFLPGLLAAGLTLLSNNAYGQLNKEYQRQESKEQICKLDLWSNAQYEYKSIFPKKEKRILVKGNDVFLISYKDKCSSKLIGYVGKDYAYSPGKIRHFSIEREELVEYYKHPQQAVVKKKVHRSLKRSQYNRQRNRTGRDW